MPALRQPVKRRWPWIFCIVAAALAAVAISDWIKPAPAQASVQFFNRGVVSWYWGHIRPVTSRYVHCRFQPTCSIYSLMAMQTYGFPKGSWLTLKRLCRCLPWVPMGTYDPVPMPPSPAVPATAPAPAPSDR